MSSWRGAVFFPASYTLQRFLHRFLSQRFCVIMTSPQQFRHSNKGNPFFIRAHISSHNPNMRITISTQSTVRLGRVNHARLTTPCNLSFQQFSLSSTHEIQACGCAAYYTILPFLQSSGMQNTVVALPHSPVSLLRFSQSVSSLLEVNSSFGMLPIQSVEEWY